MSSDVSDEGRGGGMLTVHVEFYGSHLDVERRRGWNGGEEKKGEGSGVEVERGGREFGGKRSVPVD